VSVLTVAGLASSTVLGFGLGHIGRWLVPHPFWPPSVVVCVTAALAVAAHEFGWVGLPLLQVERQTPGMLAHLVPPPVATAAWGFDLGLTFTTYLTFAGPWLLLSVAVASADPYFAATLFGAYWIGRVLTLWVMPLLLVNPGPTPLTPHGLLAAISRQTGLFRTIHAIGGLIAAANLVLLLH
jgi:hypothetical protein